MIEPFKMKADTITTQLNAPYLKLFPLIHIFLITWALLSRSCSFLPLGLSTWRDLPLDHFKANFLTES